MNIEIKNASLNDYEKIYALNVEFATLYNMLDKLTVNAEQLVKDQDFFHCRVAFMNNELVAFSSFFFAYYTWTGKAIYIDDLFVTASHRNLGIGDILLNDIIEIGKSKQCNTIVWQVSEWNLKAQKFYQKKGAMLNKGEINCVLKII